MYGLAYLCSLRGDVRRVAKFTKRILELDNRIRLDIYKRLPLKRSASSFEARVSEGDVLMAAAQENLASEKFAEAVALSSTYYNEIELSQLLSKVAIDGNVVVSQFAYNYYDIFKIWYAHLKKLNVTNFLAIALDPIVYSKMKALDIPCFYLPIFGYDRGVRTKIWRDTLLVRRAIIDLGYNYIHSDIDAIWLKDPRRSFSGVDADIVFSEAHGTPGHINEKWGFVACGGFYMMKSSDATKLIFDEYIEFTERYGHDQNGMNELLQKYGTTWEDLPDGSHRGYCRKLNLKLHVVPQSIIARPSILEMIEETCVMHPTLSCKTISGKIEMLKSFEVDTSLTL